MNIFKSWFATPKKSIFQRGDFLLNSGVHSGWKLELDEATDAEMSVFAYMAMQTARIPLFGSVCPVPKGKSESLIDNAQRIADAMLPYVVPGINSTLIVDDVYTTGGSINQARLDYNAQHPSIGNTIGFVLWARNPPPSWVRALFTMGG